MCLSVEAIKNCIQDVRAWLVLNKLMFHDSKTEYIMIGSRQQLSTVNTDFIRVGNCDILPLESLENLGGWFEKHMPMNTHIGKICCKGFRELYSKRQIWKYFKVDSTKTLVHAFVNSQVDYCSCLLYGLQFNLLQKVCNAAARIIFLIPMFNHITPVLI